MNQVEFKEALIGLTIDATDSVLASFDRYAQLLVEKNKVMNLTAITDREEINEKHFYDSLLLYPFVKDKLSLCDVGSGAGFPGLVLAIVMPSCEITLLEPTLKRCNFLNEVISDLGLKNIIVVNQRAEDFSQKRESYDIVTARAVANLNLLSELCLPLVKVNGLFIAMKGSKGLEEVDEASKAICVLGGAVRSCERSLLSDDSLRYNIIIEKEKKSPAKYPRAYGAMKKRPL